MAKILNLPTSALRARITLYLPVDVADGVGGSLRNWQATAGRFAQVIQSSQNGSDATRGKANSRLRVVIRRAAAPFILPLRMQWRGQMYRVVQLEDVPEAGVQQLICEILS